MPDTHIIAEVAADETLLRRLAGEVLNPGPWKHFWVCGHDPTRPYCLRCDEKKSPQNRDANCPAIKTPSGSLPDIVSQLVQKAVAGDPLSFIERLGNILQKSHRTVGWPLTFLCWVAMPSAEQAACLLAVMLTERIKT